MSAKSEKRKEYNEFNGTWHIFEMEDLGEDFLNMEVQAYLKIGSDNMGEFQFALVSGKIDGRVVDYSGGERFEFMWEGNDECDSASGMGWAKISGKDMLEGEIKIHLGDSSYFLARRVESPTYFP